MGSEFKGDTCPVCRQSFDDCPHSLDEARNHKAKRAERRSMLADFETALRSAIERGIVLPGPNYRREK